MTLTPRIIFWGVLIGGALILALIFQSWLASLWPWSAENRAERAEKRAAVAEAVVEGQAEIAGSVERHTIIIREADRIAADAEIEARTAPDAETPLDPDRADRLRRSDERLCLAFPGICSDPAADAP